MHHPERDPFYQELWADIQEGIEAANRGELIDAEEVFAEFGLDWNEPVPEEPPSGIPTKP